ncbi:vWA domain-containing protein [Hydrogenimonas sp.]
MHFEFPWILGAALLFLFCERRCPLRLELLYFPHMGRLARHARRRSWLQAFKWMAWSGLVVALASPVVERSYTPSHAMGRDMVLVVDASRSMDEGFSLTLKRNKFETLKKVLEDFIQKRRHDRLGLVVFGEYAYVASPLTFDRKILASMVPYLTVGMAGERTAIYDALTMVVKLLKESEAKSKVVVLITDGRNTAGKVPLGAAMRLLEEYGVKLYTIGIGQGRNYDAGLLREMADQSGGRFFEASDPEALKKVYEAIDRLEPSEVAAEPVVEKRYYYIYPLFVAAMSLLLYLFFLNRAEVG